MSLAHEMRVLELESQIELLERLQLLTNFGSNLITVDGGKGSGKSWLAQRYLEAWAQDQNQCLLLCHPSQNDEQHRAMLLSQLVSDPLFNQHDPLVDSLQRLLDGDAVDVVIVIDDAHLLSEILVSELWLLVLEAQHNSLWNINVVLFTESNCLDPLLTRLSYGQEHKPIDIEIDALSAREAEQFFESLVVRYVADDMEKRVRSAFKKTKPLPGELMALGDLKVEKRIIIQAMVGSPVRIAMVVLLLIIMIGGGYWWLLSQPMPEDPEQAIVPNLELTVVSEPEASLSASTSSTSSSVNRLNQEAEVDDNYAGAEDDSLALPPNVVSKTASVGFTEPSQQRVVITSDVVDALLDGKSDSIGRDVIETDAADTSSVDTSVIVNAVADAMKRSQQAAEPVVDSTEAADTQSAIADATAAIAVNEEQAAPNKVITFSFARDELKALSPRSYTLQLAAMNSMEDVQVFIEDNNIQQQVRVYPTARNGQDWYIVTYQDYPTIQLARDAVETLPKALQNLGPWAKSMNQVHREIERAK